MPSADTLLAAACESKFACLDERDLLIVIAQSLADSLGKTAEELLADACESGIACLGERDLWIVAAQAAGGGGGGAGCTVTTASLPDGTAFSTYTETLTASAAATWAIIAGTLPDGLTLVGDEIGGTPTEDGTFPITVQATTASGTCTKDLSITINPFEPPQLANLYLWARPDSLDALANGAPVVTWPDDSGSGNDLTGVNGPTWTTGELNGWGAVAFNGTNQSAVTVAPAVPATTEYTAFIVARHNSAAGTGTVLQVGNASGYALLKDAGNREIVHRAVAALTDAAITDNYEIWTARKTAVPLTTLRLNGTTGLVISNSGSTMTAPDNLITLGWFVGTVFFLDGFIAEVLLYDTNLSDADRDAVEAYLTAKFL